MGLFARLAFVSLVATVTAEGYGSQDNGYGPGGGSGYGGRGGGSGYGGGYGQRFNPYHVVRDVFTADKPLNVLDKLWERVDDVTRQNKFAAEGLDAVDARMSLIKKVVDELELVTFPEIYSTETNQNNDITNLWEHLNDLMNKLTDLENEIGSVEYQNGENSARILDLERTWSSEKYTDVEQDGDVGNLHVAVKDFKSKLFVVLGNEFELFTDKVEVTAGKLAGTKGRERSRMCETGTVTLKADDRKAEYVFQSTFSEVPGVIYSITGLNWNLDARDVQQHFGYGPPPREPNAFGLVVLAYPTKRSVTFESYELSFGDTQGMTADIDFQVCTIGPGSEESDAHDVTVPTEPPAPTTGYRPGYFTTTPPPL